MKMVTEWYRAFRFQVCPFSRYLEFHYKGQGIEKREQPPAQVAARLVRDNIAKIMAGELTPAQAGDYGFNDFLVFGRERGFVGTKNNFTAAKEIAHKIREVLANFRFDPSFTVLQANKEIPFALGKNVTFVSRPTAVVNSSATGVFYLMFFKITSTWRQERAAAMHHDYQLMSEMDAVREAFPGEFAGAIVQVISMASASYEVPFLVPYDKTMVDDWQQDARDQEERVCLHSDSPSPLFPQYRHSCEFPYPCQFKAICWGDLRVSDKPQDDPRYMTRKVELVTEKELIASWRKA